MIRLTPVVALLSILVLSSCAPPVVPTPSGAVQPAGEAARPTRSRTLVLVGRSEMPSLASKPIQSLGLTSGSQVRLFNAGLALPDDRGIAQPYLAEALPQLNTDSWRVFPDGRMEVTYRLRAGLTWHDGQPLRADDFVFSWQVYAVPDLGHAASPPIGLIDEAVAVDDRTLLIRWKRPYAEAGELEAAGGSASPSLPALPRHLLESAFRESNWDNFATLTFWSREYVGLGPFKLDRWEAGSYLEAVPFEGHALGRPKIERIRVIWAPDFNTTVATMLAGEAHITIDDSIRFQQGMILRREWGPQSTGTVLVYPSLWRWTQAQQRPEYASPEALMDSRVRKALAHAVDKDALNGALFEGEGIMTETPVPPNFDYFPEVDRASVKYPYDLRRAEQLMTEAGFRKGPDGTYVDSRGNRFTTELGVFQSPQNESEMSIMAASWRQAGYDIKEVVWPAAQARDRVLRATAPGLTNTSGPAGEATLTAHRSSELPRPDNRWSGSNRGGWTDPEFDRLAEAFNTTLEKRERVQLLAQLARVFSADAAVISLYFNPSNTAFVNDLTGPRTVVPTSNVTWNIHQWEFR